jgi:CBS domain-containing protein
MTKDVACVRPDTSVRHAAEVMLARRVSGLPVIDDEGRLAGIVTEGDLMRRAELRNALSPAGEANESSEGWNAAYVKSHSWRVGDVMTATVVSVREEEPLSGIATLLDQLDIKRVPVVRGECVVGVVSRSDLLRAIVSAPSDGTAAGDAAIRVGILARLREDLRLADPIPHVVVAGGIVHLRGSVRSQAERDAVRVVVEGVRGVAGIEDHLHVVGAPA